MNIKLCGNTWQYCSGKCKTCEVNKFTVTDKTEVTNYCYCYNDIAVVDYDSGEK